VSEEADLDRLLLTYRRLSELLGEIQQAVMAADTGRLSELVLQQEELMRQAADTPLPKEIPDRLAREIHDAAQEAARRNTTNAVLLSEQLALIQAIMKAILGKQRAIDRLA
jgi:hypothetical protein